MPATEVEGRLRLLLIQVIDLAPPDADTAGVNICPLELILAMFCWEMLRRVMDLCSTPDTLSKLLAFNFVMLL